MTKPPRSEAELGISEQEIAAGWRSTWRSARSRRAEPPARACEGRARRRERRPWRSRSCSAVPRRAGGRRALGSPRSQLATPAPRGGAVPAGFQAKQPAAARFVQRNSPPTTTAARSKTPRPSPRPSCGWSSTRCAAPVRAPRLYPARSPRAAEKLIPWLTDQPTSALSSRLRHGRRRARSRRVPRGRRPCAVGRVRCTC